MRKVSIAALCAVLVSIGAAPGAAARAGDPVAIDFALSDGNTMAGFLFGASEDRPLILLVHGASDTHTVFDLAPGFSLARRLARAGYGVLAVDRVGYGASSRPPGDTLGVTAQAAQLHEAVQAVRAGALGFTPPAVITLGPSLGADVVLVEAATYGDVDGVVIAFHSSQLQPALFEVDVGAWFAQGDYFDFGVEFRTRFFYAEPWALGWIVELDNATRSLVPRGEIASALADESGPARAQIDVPVLLLQAEADALFVPRDDSALFSAAPSVDFVLLRHTGHKGFSHPTSLSPAVRAIRTWLDAHF